MKVLITGGAGILGQKVVQRFVSNGHQARVFDLPQVDYSPFEGMAGVEIVKGDIRDKDIVRQAVEGVDAVLHLAALIPPASERNREVTLAINVGGTSNLLEAIGRHSIHFVLTSSVATYGDTTKDTPPIRVTHPQVVTDIYSESKIESERVTLASGVPYTIFRIAPIAVPEVMEPPEVWPFMAEQRVEWVNRDDVADALYACTQASEAVGKIWNIAGGPTWQMLGKQYVATIYEAMGLDPGEARFSSTPGWFDWYDTSESQAVLHYQNTPFPEFIAQLRRAAAEAFGW